MRIVSILLLSLVSTKSFALNKIKQQLQTTCYEIKGMVCHGCEENLKKELAKLKGIKTTAASFKNKFAQATYDQNLTKTSEIESVFKKLGYKAKTCSCKNKG